MKKNNTGRYKISKKQLLATRKRRTNRLYKGSDLDYVNYSPLAHAEVGVSSILY